LSTDVSKIRSLLLARAITPVISSDLPGEGFLLDEILHAIAHADLVVAVLDAQGANENIIFELGYAHALKKRIVILTPSGIASLPFDLSGFVTIKAKPDNIEAVDFALSQALAAPKSRNRRLLESVSKSKPIGSYSDQLVKELEQLGSEPTESALLSLIVSALNASGVSVLKESKLHGIRPDIAIWSDELESWVGNPFLIEIKLHLKTSQLNEILAQFVSYTGGKKARRMLLLYWDADLSAVERLFDSSMLLLQIRKLLIDLKTKSFTEIVRDLRNQAVHKASF
jgi:hypothetical protein